MRCSDELVERVDLARGDVARERWLRKAVEQALGSSAGYPSNSPAGLTAPAPRFPAPAEQPVRTAREFRPYPKGGR